MFDEEINAVIDHFLKAIIGITFVFFLVASLFPSTGYVVGHWVFIGYFAIEFLLLLDRSVDDESLYFLRTILYILVVGVIGFGLTQLWWFGLLGIPFIIYINRRHPIKRAFITGFLMGFWVLHFFLIYWYKIDFLHSVTMHSFFSTVLSWRIVIVVAFAYLYSKCFEGYDDIEENTILKTKEVDQKWEYQEGKQKRIEEEIRDAEKKLLQTTDPSERQRLLEFISKRHTIK